MSRHAYIDDCDDYLQYGRWRGQVTSAIRGKRGQAFLKELLAALEAMPNKRLITCELKNDKGEFCTLGVIGAARGVELEALNVEDYDNLADVFGIAAPLVREIEFENDELGFSPEKRWEKMYCWVKEQIKPGEPTPAPGGGEGK